MLKHMSQHMSSYFTPDSHNIIDNYAARQKPSVLIISISIYLRYFKFIFIQENGRLFNDRYKIFSVDFKKQAKYHISIIKFQVPGQRKYQ